MRIHISWAEKVIKVSQEIGAGNHPPLPAPVQTTPDSSGCMIKCPRELNQLKNRAFSLGYFPPGKFHSPLYLKNTEILVWSVGQSWVLSWQQC